MIKPWLWLPPKWSHDLAPFFLKLADKLQPEGIPKWRPYDWKGLHFPNRLGLAAGMDKRGDQIQSWWRFGAGFMEVGTIVPQAQLPNPGKIMDRHNQSMSVWNKMGFPSHGVEATFKYLQTLPKKHPSPLFLNIGKNRTTKNEEALQDYLYCAKNLSQYADGLVINISSPNTAGLRELAQKNYLEPLLKGLRSGCGNQRLLLKLSPDMEKSDLRNAIQVAAPYVDGFVLTNTTTSRPPGSPFPIEGGLSGKPLAALSETMLKEAVSELGQEKSKYLLVSVGGIMSVADIQRRLDLGADLVEVYAALVFHGPWFFRSISDELTQRFI